MLFGISVFTYKVNIHIAIMAMGACDHYDKIREIQPECVDAPSGDEGSLCGSKLVVWMEASIDWKVQGVKQMSFSCH